MNESLEQLEQEVEALLASVSDKLSVQPPESVTKHVKSVIHYELDEHWLDSHSSPKPSAQTLSRVKSAVYDQLQQAALQDQPGRRLLKRYIGGLVAAAAIIGIWVGVINQTHQTQQPEMDLNLFVEAADEVYVQDSFTTAINMELDTIEESIANLSTTFNDDLYMLEDIGNQIDSLFLESESFDDV